MSASRAAESIHTRDADWASRYSRSLIASDIVVIVWAVFGSQIVWFGLAEANVNIDGRFGFFALSYSALSAGLCLAWALFLAIASTRDRRIVGIGTTEYARVIRSSVMLFGLLAIVSYLAKAEVARGYFVTALPFGLAALLLSRWIWRQYLNSRRLRGEMSSQVVLVGSRESATRICLELARTPQAGYHVVGAFLTERAAPDDFLVVGVPVLGMASEVVDALGELHADTVIVTGSDGLPADQIRQISWSLEPGRQHLVVSPGLVDVAGPRIHTRPVSGLPLIHVETPRYEGGRRVIKRLFDLAAGGLLLAILSVPYALVAATIRLSSEGPVYFRQERVGINGSRFSMLKFRSMVEDAEAQLSDLKRSEGDAAGNAVMFKMADDPRVTPIGRFLRRYSLDELPQLINVMRGEMSLVGPRPPLPSEVEAYESHVNRRFLVTPGITGLWQVSGRSNLDWEDTVRLDLYYVENWSLTSDLQILWRTFSAVLKRDGAY